MPNITLSRTQPGDAIKVFGALWARGEEEVRAFGVSMADVLAGQPDRDKSRFAYTINLDGEPVVVTGAVKSQLGWSTYFFATDGFASIGREGTRLLTRQLAKDRAECPDGVLFCFSATTHPAARRWFSLLGFTPLSKDGSVTKYMYIGGSARQKCRSLRAN